MNSHLDCIEKFELQKLTCIIHKHVWFSEEAQKTWTTFEGSILLPSHHPYINNSPLDPHFQLDGITVSKCNLGNETYLCIEKSSLNLSPKQQQIIIKFLRKQLSILAKKIMNEIDREIT